MIEISTYPASDGLNSGLNKGLKIGKFLKKNVRMRNVSLKNAVKVGKFAIPIATSLIPGGAMVGKGLSLLSKAGKVGKIASKIVGSKAVSSVVKFAQNPAVKQFTSGISINNALPATQSDYGSEEANFDAPVVQQGGQIISANPIPQPVVQIPQQSFDSGGSTAVTQSAMIPVKEANVEALASDSPMNTQTKNNTML